MVCLLNGIKIMRHQNQKIYCNVFIDNETQCGQTWPEDGCNQTVHHLWNMIGWITQVCSLEIKKRKSQMVETS